MAERIIDGLEGVKVEKKQGDQVPVPSGQANGVESHPSPCLIGIHGGFDVPSRNVGRFSLGEVFRSRGEALA
ncbi:hypothetical protein [Halomonas salinarum]|uniref:hypothetical protein n=1 Tax=Halomonas salinarum TaxID=1158993 RepID=UPI001FD8067B|nr:hypothetical protein [Halomonas salinarum]